MELGGGSHLPLSQPAIGEGVGDSCGGASAATASGPSGRSTRGDSGSREEQAGVVRAFPGVFQPWVKGLGRLVQAVHLPLQSLAHPDSLDPLDLHKEGVLLIEGQ